MAADMINITPKELETTLTAIGRKGSCVYSAEKKGDFIIIQLVGESSPIRHKLPEKRKTAKTTTTPRKPAARKAATTAKPARASKAKKSKEK
jgi:hypothetical protein